MSKVPTKVTVAKKLLNKKIKVNTHIKFDGKLDHGDCGTSNGKLDNSIIGKKSIALVCQETHQSGMEQESSGIKLEEARISLQASDDVDQKRERERVRATHRERRRKTHPVGADKSEALLRIPSSDKDSELEEDATPSLDEPVKKRIKIASKRENEEQLGVEPTPVTLVEDEELALHLLNS